MSFTQVPNEALDRMTELSAGALRLYLLLLRYRNRKTGKCCPSAQTLARAMDMERRHVFRLKRELAQAGWAQFNGGDVVGLLGFTGDKNVTTPDDIPATVKNVTSDKKVTSQGQKCHPLVTKKSVTYKEEPEERTILNEPEGKARLGAVPSSVAFVRNLTHRYPDKTLWPRIVQTLGEDFDEGRLTECYENWVSHGWNKMNLVWLFEWYAQGIPQNRNGPGRPSLAERNRAAGEEAGRMLGIEPGDVIEGEIV